MNHYFHLCSSFNRFLFSCLAPFKFVTFNTGVNVTLGLPIIRTSVDHGTALDIAGKGVADAGSMLEAIRLAFQLAQHRKTTLAHASGA